MHKNRYNYGEIMSDLQSSNPELSKEWNFEKNGDVKPSDISAGSCKKVWWKCKNGHEWEAAVSSRSKGSGCPFCSGKRIMPGYNDLLTLNPEIAHEWHPTKNDGLEPSQVSKGSCKKVWWVCSKCHNEWVATVASRTKGSNCPFCSKKTK